ncbi:CRISPR-associated endonuclease Cas2 [Goodfellowiella coeruleoviolacea]|uniref:CRISPR-associated endoribonuclease Cas2 n=1 Tax=Goodfellowiella coeruleoviolacea TaxID=334858 RepID=A0AAE3KGZ9_9PSEU|nr:CRISPR-associated endonuclease Cas2 [Goodfellowiella coeruleoviolacea]MCP2166775.1 CRISPR-associated protein Cas2 [Goodfellowiella coeruleoviolacea]
MDLLITYDVNTTTPEGQRRLRQVAKTCEGIGHRVQKSVFEVVCDQVQRLRLEARLLEIIDADNDSVRIYQMNHGAFELARHLGAATDPDHRGPLIV